MAKPTAINFTQASVKVLPSPTKGIKTYKDVSHPILSLYVTSKGVKTYFVRKRVKGADLRIVIGKASEISVETARKQATVLCGQIAERKDPTEEKRAQKERSITFGEHFKRYLNQYSKIHKSSWEYDEREINLYVSDWFNKKLSDIKKTNVEKRHQKIGEENGRVQANTILRRLSSIFNKAIEWGWDGTNPTKGIKKFREVSRDRFIQPFEMPYLKKALAQETNETTRDYLSILMLTGARKTNTLKMKWTEINWERLEWRIPITKNGEPLVVPLVSQAIDILSRRKLQSESIWVFPQDDNPIKHLFDPTKAWKRILASATLDMWLDEPKLVSWVTKNKRRYRSYLSSTLIIKRLAELAEMEGVPLPGNLMDIRLHDIRRTFGSYQALTGASLQIIGKSLGHKSPRSTQIYSRLNLDPVRSSIEKAVATMANF
jgi:integrase